MPGLTVREAYGQDVGVIAELWLALVEEHQTLDSALPAPAADGEVRYAHLVHSYIQRGDGKAFVAVDSRGGIHGYALGIITDLVPDLFESPHGGMIADIFVYPAYRRNGVGADLARHLLEWFVSKGVRHVEWDVAARNPAALAFWKSVGGQQRMVRMGLVLDADDN